MTSKHKKDVTVGATKVVATDGSEQSKLEKRVSDLERQLKSVSKERDELARDVEALCISGSDPVGVSYSTVISSRIKYQDAELADCQSRLEAALADCASLREDYVAMQDAKRTADSRWQGEREQRAAVEKDLQFYQQQSAQALGDRDLAAWEAEGLRRQVSGLEQQLAKERGKLIAEEAQKLQLQVALETARRQQLELRDTLKQLEALPQLRNELEQLKFEKSTLQRQVDDAQGTIAEHIKSSQELQRQLEDAKAQVQATVESKAATEKKARAAREKLETEIRKLQGEVAEVSNELLASRQLTDELDGNLAAALAELEVLRAATDGELSVARQQLDQQLKVERRKHEEQLAEKSEVVKQTERQAQDVRQQMEELMKQKVETLMKLSEEQARSSMLAQELAAAKAQLQASGSSPAAATGEVHTPSPASTKVPDNKPNRARRMSYR